MVLELAGLVTLKNLNQYRDASDQLVRELKDVLSEVCVEYIDADIYILDEFQRFKELVDQDSESETAEIARRIFGKQNARILLLSATPFKAFTGGSAMESGEENYKEFRTILKFLFDDDAFCLDEYEIHRQALFKQLLELGSANGEVKTIHRDAVQEILRRIMCRTERLSVSDDFNAMTIDKCESKPLRLTAGDIQNFVATDNVVRALNEDSTVKNKLHAPVEFCKSAPFPLSFLDGYKIKEKLKVHRKDSSINKELQANKAAWINHKKVNGFKLDLSESDALATNAKLNHVLAEVLDRNGENLLWVPPSLPCYPLAGTFENSGGFSKTLIFSSWLMVPRMLSSMISYEVERRTIGNVKSMDSQEKKPRKYFRSRQRPVRQLVFSQKKTDDGESPNNMSNFAILFPSQTLAGLFDPKSCLVQGRSLDDIRSGIIDRLRTLIREANLEQYSQPSGESERWYWAAPLLLDRHNNSFHESLTDWFDLANDPNQSTFLKSQKEGKSGQSENSSKEKHFEEFRRCFEKPSQAGLGRLPNDLPEVLADIAIAGPAVTTLRSVTSCFSGSSTYFKTLFAFDIAGEFLSLFNKPESISTVRLSTAPSTYLRRVMAYCVDGCLQSVMDEFFHLLEPDCPTIWDLFDRLVDSMNLGTASINVDDLSGFLGGEKKKMRCHYAVDLGNQRMETDEGKKRIKGIRHNFNSPFRPFVLATTSIGQEGLDFHTYCRKIVHWNLPSNPIDIEQREGRINRFKGLVIRQQIASKYGKQLDEELLNENSVWDSLFKVADKAERVGTGKCELIPYWHVKADDFQIERIIPFYPFSRDRAKLASLMKTLAIYRLAFGQPRQAELVEHLLNNISEDQLSEVRSKLIIDLSPISYRKNSLS